MKRFDCNPKIKTKYNIEEIEDAAEKQYRK